MEHRTARRYDSDIVPRAIKLISPHPSYDNLYTSRSRQQYHRERRKRNYFSTSTKKFNISLSSCFNNYTQNFKKDTYQAKRHHTGRGINAYVSLHKPPRIGVEHFIVNIRWATDNVNLSMIDIMIDFKDAKAKVQADISPVQKPGSTWRKITPRLQRYMNII